jgi:rhamnose utilization protein RhaD (predicted bifunctional aldolase and dehydrogenase)/NAD(P)-dependent dehydrogenase (short-subunit alcohol dehydrogenase family)
MRSLWSKEEADGYVAHYRERCNADVALRVYSSRLIGRDPALVLHGGGNTSVKTVVRDDLGRQVEVLCVKGSGFDLQDMEPEGLPALRLEPLRALRHLAELGDEDMVNAQRTRMLNASAPNPSVETLLHAFLPHKFIDHSHADAMLSMLDQPEAEKLCLERFGRRFAFVPYVMPGFALAKLAAEVYEKQPDCQGLLLLQHGFFTFGQTAEESYVRHVQAVDEAEQYCRKRRYWSSPRGSIPPVRSLSYATLAPILRGLLGQSGDEVGRVQSPTRRYALELRTAPETRAFVDDPQVDEFSQVGCATPDHVIRTKRYPLVLELDPNASESAMREHIAHALHGYRERYRDYVQRQMARKGIVVRPIDPDPRVILAPGIGLIAVGATPKEAAIAADIYEHTIDVIRNANAIGSYQALPEADIFDMEYWSLEQAKLGKAPKKPLEGQIVYVTGAASGIGAATARLLAQNGATLYLVDRNETALASIAKELKAASEALDLTNEQAVRQSFDRAVQRFGGLDGVISNAGTAPQSPIDSCPTELLESSLRINLLSHQFVLSAASAVLKRQGTGGFLLVNASKSAWNPGPDFGPYAIAKAALLALMKQYALELGGRGIRCNAVNADRIRTSLLDQQDIAARAAARGLDTDAYYRTNLLQREVTAADVAQAFLSLALAPATTGSVITVDGGNIAASPR